MGPYKRNFPWSKNYVKSITRWGEGLLNSAPFYPQILLKIANCMHQEALRKVLLAALEYILPKMPPKNFVKKMKIKKTMTKMLKKFHRNFNFCNDHFDIIASTPQESSISVLFNLDPIDINPMVKSAPRCLPAQGISNAPNGSRRSTGCWCYGWWSSQCRRRLVRLGLVRNSSSRLKNDNEPPGQLNPITGNLQLGVKESFATGCCWLWLEKKHKNEKSLLPPKFREIADILYQI